MGQQPSLILVCASASCPLYHYRMGKIDVPFGEKRSPLTAIRHKCVECAGGPKEARQCTMPDCTLYIYRFGKRPAKEKNNG